MPNTLLFNTVIIFVAGLLFAILARQFRQSPLIGYLVAGLVVGPFGLRWVPDEENVRFLADVGIIFLMFALGVQLSFRHLLEVKTTAIFGGLLQIIMLIGVGLGLGLLFGLSPGGSLVLGYALALSSSVVLVRLLGDADEFHTRYGRIALGISVMQDLMAVVLISTVPFFSPDTATSFSVLSVNLGKAILFVIWTIVLARWIAPIILRWASATGSRDIFLPTVAVLSLGGAMMSGVFGFSFALGAFLAGLVISESLFSQAVLSEIIPLRDIFGMLFFVTLGMLVNPALIVQQIVPVTILLLVVVIGKTIIIFLVVLLFKHHPYTALITGVSLSQAGEFSFIIAREAEATGVISTATDSIILSVAILSIILTPILLPVVRWVYRRLSEAKTGASFKTGAFEEMEGHLPDVATTVLLCGYGRVGRTIAQALDTFRIPFMVVDIDRRAVEALRRRGIHAIYGDAANLRLLDRIGAGKYHLGVIAIGEFSAARMTAMHLRRLNPEIRLLVRSHTIRETADFLAMGVEGVVHIELEASLAFVQEVLTTADVDEEIVAAYLDDIRIGYYEGLHPHPRED